MPDGERRLAAIMYTDIVGYTALTQKDESSTLQALETHRSLLRPLFTSRGGREIKTTGDGFIVEFQSALNAVLCAVAIQQMMHDRKLATGETISLRIGIHVGDVVERGGDILGDAVNIASRIEPMAEHGGVCISSQVYEHVRNKSDIAIVSLGEKSLKNVSTPVGVYKVQMPWEQSATTEALAFPTNRIAVLPFTSFSSNPDDAYFADGMTEEVISTVSGISGLDVISRTSVMGYKGSTKKVEDIGKELKVGAVLEGSFRKAGNRIRVTTQLIEVAKDRHLWAQNYDRNLDDIFEVQSDIAKRVAEALRVKIGSPEMERIERKPTNNTMAYASYLKGRFLWSKRGLSDITQAVAYFEQAVKEDPQFALGYSGLADCCLMLRGNWGLDLETNLRKAKAFTAKALELDPTSAEARTSSAFLKIVEFHLEEAEEEFRSAVELKPSYATAHQWYTWALVPQKKWDQASEQIQRASELDPLSPIISNNLGSFYYWRGEYEKALAAFKEAGELGFWNNHGDLAITYGRLRRFTEMRSEFPLWVQSLVQVYPKVGITAEVLTAYFEDDLESIRGLLPELETYYREAGLNAYWVALLHFRIGEKDKGFDWLQTSYSLKEGASTWPTRIGSLWIDIEPALEKVRADPRYLDLLKRLGLDQTVDSK